MNPLSAKAALWFGLALLLSLSANAWQFRNAGVVQGRNEGEAERADLSGQLAQTSQALAVSKALETQGHEDHSQLLVQLDAIAERGQQFRTVYRAAAAAKPLAANCAPGAERVQANNALLGPQQEAH